MKAHPYLRILVHLSVLCSMLMLLGCSGDSGGAGSRSFELQLQSTGGTVPAGASMDVDVFTYQEQPWTESILLSAQPSISGLSYSFSSQSVLPNETSVLTIQTTAALAPGNYSILVRGQRGPSSDTAAYSLTVTSPLGFSLTPSASSCNVGTSGSAILTIQSSPISGFSGTVVLSASPAISGLTYSFAPTSISEAGSTTLTFQALTTAFIGSYQVTVTGTSGLVVRSTVVTVNIVCGFSLTPSISQLTVAKGSGGSLSIGASLTSFCAGGGSVNVVLSATPAIPGVSYAFSPQTITALGSSTLSVQAATSAALGTYVVTVVGNNGTVSSSASFLLVVSDGSQVRTFSANPGIAIPDANSTGVSSSINSTLQSSIRSISVTVNIVHSYCGDLEVMLMGPGASVLLHNRTGGGNDDIMTTYPLITAPFGSLSALAGSSTSGTWTLRVRDLDSFGVGTLNSWRISFNGERSDATPGSLSASASGMQTLTRTITFSETGSVSVARVRVDMNHTYMGDLEVRLTAPDGTSVLLHSQGGGATDFVPTVYPDLTAPFQSLSSMAGRAINGTWSLMVRDVFGPADGGTLSGWALSFEAL